MSNPKGPINRLGDFQSCQQVNVNKQYAKKYRILGTKNTTGGSCSRWSEGAKNKSFHVVLKRSLIHLNALPIDVINFDPIFFIIELIEGYSAFYEPC
jgi:hypothetical protein